MAAAVGVKAAAGFPAPASDLPPAEAALKTVAKTVANPEVERHVRPVAKTVAKDNDDDDLLDAVDRGKSTAVTEIGKGWRLETNSDGRLRWRWQIKDDDGLTVTYTKSDGSTGYARGSRYVGITQSGDAKKTDRKRRKGRHKSSGRRTPSGQYSRRHDGK